MRILVIGAGGREHALVWRLAADRDVSAVLCSPGNPGIATLCECQPVDVLDPLAVRDLAVSRRVDLTVVGPEAPLEQGLADRLREAGLPVVGPTARGAALECSKVFAKEFMRANGIPTARFRVVESERDALGAVSGGEFGFPVVLKADGLAAGKGVVIAGTYDEAAAAIRAAMVDRVFGPSGARLVIEECLSGPEVSAFYLCDGERALALSTAQDHKRIWDNDLGPNTGGMGAFAPSPLMDATLAAFTEDRVVTPVLRGLSAVGAPYIGFLYVSLMLTPEGPKVIEFNVRLGDPEAQVILPQIEGPFAATLLSAAVGGLAAERLTLSSDRLVGVVLASMGYPSTPKTGQPIEGLAEAAAGPGALVFHAGTALSGGRLVTAGGRVLTVVGRGETFRAAMTAAYAAVDAVRFEGMQYRRDIGQSAMAFDPH